ncbi:FAD-linked oxidase C-terminal domain-containing protein [Persicirhabdus sediminis]|uniref:FAD-binding protein n=1 Tax=Persicirhabdus sediminis TaxID=454144 RepID=A0A8J7MD58_9BACT|nr:FAD-linked oxidase C-terminal domain-containing protein [Persicirhabdus sediminis]MBK1790793.1 FAD-binding protein [Persicirhabdus sediminis]
MSDLYQNLVSLLGAGKVSSSAEDITTYSIDRWNASAPPEVVVFAESTADVSATLKYAHEHDIPVYGRSGGSGYTGGCVPVNGGIALALERMDKILEINPRDGIARAQPGVITKTLADTVREHGWYYPPDPASLKECGIGGNVATNAGGPRCLKYGVTRSYILGLEVVLADGSIMHTGGRCHKNKTGFDLVGLFCGSEGMLGIITEVTVRIIPHPQTRAMLGVAFADFTAAAAAVNAILDSGVLPSALEITDAFTLEAARDYLGEDKLPPGDAYLIVEIDGQLDTVASEIQSLKSFIEGLGALRIDLAPDEDACEEIWQLRRDFSYGLRNTGMTKLNEDIVVPRSKLVQLVEYCQQIEADTGIPVACFGHAGDGNIHTNLMVGDYDDPKTKQSADKAVDQLFQWVLANDGAITGEHGIGLAKKKWAQQALGETSYLLHQRIKNELDPKGILNPGKFL